MKVLFVNSRNFYEIYSDVPQGIELCLNLLSNLLSDEDLKMGGSPHHIPSTSPPIYSNLYNLDKSFSIDEARLAMANFIDDLTFEYSEVKFEQLLKFFSKE